MGNRILEKAPIAEGICRFIIDAPKIARKRKAGNFVVVRANEYAERIPLTIVDSDLERGSITLIIQTVGSLGLHGIAACNGRAVRTRGLFRQQAHT